jgi:hypothetical protein
LPARESVGQVQRAGGHVARVYILEVTAVATDKAKMDVNQARCVFWKCDRDSGARSYWRLGEYIAGSHGSVRNQDFGVDQRVFRLIVERDLMNGLARRSRDKAAGFGRGRRIQPRWVRNPSTCDCCVCSRAQRIRAVLIRRRAGALQARSLRGRIVLRIVDPVIAGDAPRQSHQDTCQYKAPDRCGTTQHHETAFVFASRL